MGRSSGGRAADSSHSAELDTAEDTKALPISKVSTERAGAVDSIKQIVAHQVSK